MEKTKRKGFNFYRSYFDVYNELNDKDKLLFIDALLKRQFHGTEPTELKGMVSFAYLSQKHNIDAQVKGFEDKTKIKLLPPCLPPNEPPCLQEKEKEKEKEQLDWSKLLSKFNEITGKSSRVVPDKAKKQILARIKEGYTKADILKGIENCYKDSHHQDTNHKYLTLEFISRPDKLEKFVNVTPIAQKKAPQYKDDWR